VVVRKRRNHRHMLLHDRERRVEHIFGNLAMLDGVRRCRIHFVSYPQTIYGNKNDPFSRVCLA
jgi:hypothetical protein